MDILISDKPYDLIWKKRGSKYLTQKEVDDLHHALVVDSIQPKEQPKQRMLFAASPMSVSDDVQTVDDAGSLDEPDEGYQQTVFTGLPYLIGLEEDESIGSSIPYICSEDLTFIIASESGDGSL